MRTLLADASGILQSTDGFIIASIAEGVLLVLVLAIALTNVRIRLRTIADNLGTLAGALDGVERVTALIAWGAENLNIPLRVIVGALPDLLKNATTVVRGG